MYYNAGKETTKANTHMIFKYLYSNRYSCYTVRKKRHWRLVFVVDTIRTKVGLLVLAYN